MSSIENLLSNGGIKKILMILLIVFLSLILIFVIYLFISGRGDVSVNDSDWCVSGNFWNNTIIHKEMKIERIINLDGQELCLAYPLSAGNIYAFSKNESLIYVQTGWQNFTRIK